ncbi:MAG: hypothetical protein O7D30_08100 [Rickettsia endosymbiont of Ixodes persulcatus]|nr:hypothetical protein [Rickettsia endosymbiont of Ixodes persulcatus]
MFVPLYNVSSAGTATLCDAHKGLQGLINDDDDDDDDDDESVGNKFYGPKSEPLPSGVNFSLLIVDF